jgi:predicted CXXCH cytochrome family protein
MGRSFSPPAALPKLEAFYHSRSDRHYAVVERDGRWFIRRYQIGYKGGVANEVEREIHYAIGSGNHARSFLSRTPSGTFVELPLTWYAEGARWGMSPGYDTTEHQDFRRRISDSCLFCHNGYPEAAASGLAAGIDCQRCHGPGRAHVEAASAGAAGDALRAAIVNPARLAPARRLEVCLQCHLETTSRPLPNVLRRYERAPFSYRPGEPLGDYALHFDHVRGTGHDDKFEINSAGYRFLKSRCFQMSAGEFTCTTCHDPHDLPRGAAAVARYSAPCRRCHTEGLDLAVASGRHPASKECTTCHMPRRRAEDAVRVVMTDHCIQRRPPARDLLAALDEVETARQGSYSGAVAPFYPRGGLATATDGLYLALAQVKDGSNLRTGIELFERLLRELRPTRGEYFLELADAWRRQGEPARALPHYETAVQRDPLLGRAQGQLGETLLRLGRPAEALAALERGLTATRDPEILLPLGVAYGQLGRLLDSVRTLTEVVRLDPDHPGAWLNLAVSLEHASAASAAETAYRAALRAQPDFSAAHERLSALLESAGDAEQAAYHREQVKRWRR